MSWVGPIAIHSRKSRLLVILAATLISLGAGGAALVLSRKPVSAPVTGSYGERLYAQGDYAAAADALRAEYRARPSAQLKRALVAALLAANDPAAALALLRRVGADALPEPETRLLSAEALLRLEQPDEAAAEIAPLAKTEPGIAALVRAQALYAKGETDGAEARLGEALRAGGAAAQSAWLLRARYALARNDFPAASAAAARAEEAGAPGAAVAALRIEEAIRSGDFERARTLLGPEKKSPRGESDQVYLRIILDAAEGRADSAAIRLRMIEPALSREPRGRLIAAYVREDAGDLAQAEKHFRRAAEAARGDAVAQDALAAFYLRRARPQDAVRAAESLADIAPDAARTRRAEALARSGDFEGAIGTLLEGRSAPLSARAAMFGLKAKASEQESMLDARAQFYADAAASLLGDSATPTGMPETDDPVALALAAERALLQGDASVALRLYENARKAAPDFDRAVAGAARAALRRSGPQAARALVLRAQAETPGDIGLRLLAARVRLGEGRPRDALDLLRPQASRLGQSPEGGSVYAQIVIDSGDVVALANLAQDLRRQGGATPQTIRVFLASGMTADAAAAARRVLIGGAVLAESTRLSLTALAAQGDPGGEDRALVAALSRNRPGDAPLAAAAARLAAGNSLTEAAEALTEAASDDPRHWARAYLTMPHAPETALRYALDLFARGETRRGAAVMAEACFWGAKTACPVPHQSSGGGAAH